MTADSKKTRAHEHELTIDAPPERVWKAITDPDELQNWFPLQAKADLRAGGHITYGWGPELTGVCPISVFEPPRHLRTGWVEAAPSDAGAEERRRLAVDWFIEGKGGQTVLRLVHSGFGPDARWDEEFDSTRRGWTYELRSLKHYLEHHAGRKRRAIWTRQQVELPAEEVWKRLTTPGGFVKEGSLQGVGVGDRYAVTLTTGDRLEGEVRLHIPPSDFAGTVQGWGGSLFRFSYETCFGKPEAMFWLSSWTLPPQEVKAIQKHWQEALQRTLA